jgi:hypothetical protein
MKTISLTIILLSIVPYVFGQKVDTIQVLFLYGSRPVHRYWQKEAHYFGGLHGGHVSIVMDSSVIGFRHVKGLHIIPNRKLDGGDYLSVQLKDFVKDTIAFKYISFKVPITHEQYHNLINILQAYIDKTPYDYAFLGMRCAAATYDVLSQIGLFKIKSRCGNITSNFYPKLFRKKMFILAKEKHWKINKQSGRKTRKWEMD